MTPIEYLRPSTLAQLAAELEADHATGDIETTGLTFDNEVIAAAWRSVRRQLDSIVGDRTADAMMTAARQAENGQMSKAEEDAAHLWYQNQDDDDDIFRQAEARLERSR